MGNISSKIDDFFSKLWGDGGSGEVPESLLKEISSMSKEERQQIAIEMVPYHLDCNPWGDQDGGRNWQEQADRIGEAAKANSFMAAS